MSSQTEWEIGSVSSQTIWECGLPRPIVISLLPPIQRTWKLEDTVNWKTERISKNSPIKVFTSILCPLDRYQSCNTLCGVWALGWSQSSCPRWDPPQPCCCSANSKSQSPQRDPSQLRWDLYLQGGTSPGEGSMTAILTSIWLGKKSRSPSKTCIWLEGRIYNSTLHPKSHAKHPLSPQYPKEPSSPDTVTWSSGTSNVPSGITVTTAPDGIFLQTCFLSFPHV